MAILADGLPTLHTRAEAWECDHNGHWNTRHFARSFQTAAEVAAALDGRAGAGGAWAPVRHLRFHGEVQAGEAVEVRSWACDHPAGGRAVVHAMLCDGRLVATAVDTGGPVVACLPDLSSAAAAPALPRGLAQPVTAPWAPEEVPLELGPVADFDLLPDGSLRFEAAVARLAMASHHHAARLGFTQAFTRAEGIGRMLAEMRHARLGMCAPGSFLRGASRLVAVSGRSYLSAHLIMTHAGAPLAVFDLCTVAVDMATRRATAVPSFMVAALR